MRELVTRDKFVINCALHLSKEQHEDGLTNRAETCRWNYNHI